MKGINTAVIKCSCPHSEQDKVHGKNNRVHNRLQGQKKRGWRCTVCGLLKDEGRG